MYKLYYDDTKEVLYQIDPEGKKTTLADTFPSKPQYSPDNTKALYISPLEWECPGSLYLFNLETGYISELVSPDENQNIPKYALWVDSETIALIIGFGWGTVSVGGNLFTFNITTNELKQVTHHSGHVQLTKIEIDQASVKLHGIKYIDDTFNEFKEYDENILIEDVLK
jgi:hypothetical protein